MHSRKKIIFFLVGVAACTAPPPPPGSAGPAEAVQEFSAALQRGDTATAWSLLSANAQRQAEAQASAARAAAGDGGPDSGRTMLFSSALPGRAVEARLVSQSGDSAEVQTAEDGGPTRSWRIQRENGRWRVDLKLGD